MFLGLSEAQQTAFDFLMEFYAPHRNRGMGRSHLMAAVIVKTAIENPGMDMQIIDHSDLVSGNRSDRRREHIQVARMVKEVIVDELPEKMQSSFNVNIAEGYVRYEPRAVTKGVCLDKRKLDNINWPNPERTAKDDT